MNEFHFYICYKTLTEQIRPPSKRNFRTKPYNKSIHSHSQTFAINVNPSALKK